MRFQFTVHHFKLFSRVKSTQDEKVCFIKGNGIKVTQVKLLSLYIFISINFTFLGYKLMGFT